MWLSYSETMTDKKDPVKLRDERVATAAKRLTENLDHMAYRDANDIFEQEMRDAEEAYQKYLCDNLFQLETPDALN